jgi:hypothetical protein
MYSSAGLTKAAISLLGRVELEHLAQPSLALLVCALVGYSAAQAADQVDRLAARQVGPEVDVTGNVRDALVERYGVIPWLLTEDGRGATAGLREAEQHPDGRRLAGPVRAEESVDFALGYREVEPIECVHAAKALFETVGLNDRVHERHCTLVSQICEY